MNSSDKKGVYCSQLIHFHYTLNTKVSTSGAKESV